LEPETTYSLGRAAEITREEVKFQRFIDRLRQKFSQLFLFALEKQLILKRVMTPEDWDQFSKKIKFKFARDTFFAELKETEMLNDRINSLNNVAPYAGKYYSHEWIRKNILKQTDENIQEIDSQIQQEENNPQYQTPMPDETGMTPGGSQQQQEPPPPRPQTGFSQ
jgi:hypothetical protein